MVHKGVSVWGEGHVCDPARKERFQREKAYRRLFEEADKRGGR